MAFMIVIRLMVIICLRGLLRGSCGVIGVIGGGATCIDRVICISDIGGVGGCVGDIVCIGSFGGDEGA